MLLLPLPSVPELHISFFRKADSFSSFGLAYEVFFSFFCCYFFLFSLSLSLFFVFFFCFFVFLFLPEKKHTLHDDLKVTNVFKLQGRSRNGILLSKDSSKLQFDD